MESKKLHTLEWKVRNYMRQHKQQQVMFWEIQYISMETK
jgi:S-ribosylhomocysteine lyase LuxS involved in autoinducer biosynthesis